MRGMGRIFNRGEVFWIAYSHRGREYRESARSAREADARRLLKKRLGEIGRGKLVGPQEERVTFEDVAADYLRDYELRGLRSLKTAEGRVAHLRSFFGLDRAIDITMDRIRAYQAHRRQEGAEAGTVNRECAALGRMFSLAVKAGRLGSRPPFPTRLEENPPRQGFFEHGEYLAIRKHLASHYQDVLDFAYYSGWRRQEIVRLEWRQVDLPGGVVRLDPEHSKTKDGRFLPLAPPLREVLARRAKVRRLGCPLVFYYRNGMPVGDWRKSWARACHLAGLPGKTLHDCRRTVARNLIRAGVPERVAMALTGHKTRHVFDRYNIVNEGDLRQATARLANYVAARPTAPTVVPLDEGSRGADPVRTRTELGQNRRAARGRPL